MDRARAAGYIDNNFVQNQQRLRKRRDHLARIKKIMNRKPGSSVTLDNSAPIVQQATAEDPRKRAKKGLFSVIIERENKVLLQRISSILLEPARNTVKEYDAMKKLIVPKNQGKARAYDQHMQKVRNDKFFASLRNQKPVYSVKKWEEEYKHQKYNQRFMREVKYVRPPGFIDPFAPSSTAEGVMSPEKKPHAQGDGHGDVRSPGRESTSSAHVHRIRNMRQEHRNNSSVTGAATTSSSSYRGQHRSRHSRSHSSSASAGTRDHSPSHNRSCESKDRDRNKELDGSGGGYDEEGFEDEDDFIDDFADDDEDPEENRELLAEAFRPVRVSEEIELMSSTTASLGREGNNPRSTYPTNKNNTSNNSSTAAVAEVKLKVYAVNAEVRCWLVNSEVIVLSAWTTDKGRDIEAEAEISLEDLAVLRGEDPYVLGGRGEIGGNAGNSLAPQDLDAPASQQQQQQRVQQSAAGGGDSEISTAFDFSSLQQIAREMVAHVELRLDADCAARLILNLVSEEDPQLLNGTGISELDTELSVASVSRRGGGGNSHSSHENMHNDPTNDSLVSEDELGDMLIDDSRQALLTMGTRVPVHFENQVITASVANLGTLIDAAKIKNRNDFVFALVKVVSTEEDQIAVTLHVMTNTVTQFKRFARPAVVKGTILKISTALPSVIHADPDLVFSFVQNMVASLKVVHSNRTGKNSLSIENFN